MGSKEHMDFKKTLKFQKICHTNIVLCVCVDNEDEHAIQSLYNWFLGTG